MTTARGKFEQLLDKLEDSYQLRAEEVMNGFQGVNENILIYPFQQNTETSKQIVEAILAIDEYSIEKLRAIINNVGLLQEEYNHKKERDKKTEDQPRSIHESALINLNNLKAAAENRIAFLLLAQEKAEILANEEKTGQIKNKIGAYISALKELDSTFGNLINDQLLKGPIDAQIQKIAEALNTMGKTPLQDEHQALFHQVKAQFEQEFAKFLPNEPKPPQATDLYSMADEFLKAERHAKVRHDHSLVQKIQSNINIYIDALKKQLPKNTDNPKYAKIQEKIQQCESFQGLYLTKTKPEIIHAYKELIENLELPESTKRFGVFANKTTSPELNLLLQTKEVFAHEYKGLPVPLDRTEKKALDEKTQKLIHDITQKLPSVSDHPHKKAVLEACKNYLIDGSGKDQLLKSISDNPKYADGHFSKETEKLVIQTLQIKQSDLEQLYGPEAGPTMGPQKKA